MAMQAKAKVQPKGFSKHLQAGIGAEGKGKSQAKEFIKNALRQGSGPKAKAKARPKGL